jgi:hypothetical protein
MLNCGFAPPSSQSIPDHPNPKLVRATLDPESKHLKTHNGIFRFNSRNS